ncbi:MAG: urease accessory protein UreD, partial [Pseudomonadota bacterium]
KISVVLPASPCVELGRQETTGPRMNQHVEISGRSDAVRQPRAVGSARVSAKLVEGRSRLSELRQQGSAKLLFPDTAGPDLDAVLLNTAGGITGGDCFRYSGTAEAGASLTITTQAAERAYRAQPGSVGTADVTLSARRGGTVHWLPQETIVFDGAAIRRRICADIADDAELLLVEPIILGRTAMGEIVRRATFSDQWRLRRGGKLVYADALRVSAEVQRSIDGPATLSGAVAFATIVLVAARADMVLDRVRQQLPKTAGVSVIRPGVLSCRIVAEDGYALRRKLVPVLELLRGAPLPKVWKM